MKSVQRVLGASVTVMKNRERLFIVRSNYSKNHINVMCLLFWHGSALTWRFKDEVANTIMTPGQLAERLGEK